MGRAAYYRSVPWYCERSDECGYQGHLQVERMFLEGLVSAPAPELCRVPAVIMDIMNIMDIPG